MAVRTQAFQATFAQTTRVTMPRTAFAKAPLRMSRPAQLQSEFLSPVASLKGLCASFTRKFSQDMRSTDNDLNIAFGCKENAHTSHF